MKFRYYFLLHERTIRHLRRSTWALAAILSSVSLIACQKAEKCQLKVEQAPAIRGIRLGMTMEEVNALYSSPVVSNPKPAVEPYGLSEEEIPGLSAPQLQGIEKINLQLLDGRVYRIRVTYNENTAPRDKRAFLLRVSESLGLPNAWEGRNTITCDGFSLNVRYRGIKHGPYVELSDSTKERELIERKKRTQAIEEEKRRTFNP